MIEVTRVNFTNQNGIGQLGFGIQISNNVWQIRTYNNVIVNVNDSDLNNKFEHYQRSQSFINSFFNN